MHVGLSQLQFITSLGCACPCLGVGVGVHSDKTKATLPFERKFRRWASVLTQCVRATLSTQTNDVLSLEQVIRSAYSLSFCDSGSHGLIG